MFDHDAFFELFDHNPVIAGHIAINLRVKTAPLFVGAFCLRVSVDGARAMAAQVLKQLRDRGSVDLVTQMQMLQKAWHGFSADDFAKLFPLLALPPRPEAPFTLLPFSEDWHRFANRFYDFEREAPASLFVALSRHYRAPMCNWNARGCFLKAYRKSKDRWVFKLELFAAGLKGHDTGPVGFYVELARGFIETDVKVYASLYDGDCAEETRAALAAIPDAPWLKMCVRFSLDAFIAWLRLARPLLHNARVIDCPVEEADALRLRLVGHEARVVTGLDGSRIVIEGPDGDAIWTYRDQRWMRGDAYRQWMAYRDGYRWQWMGV